MRKLLLFISLIIFLHSSCIQKPNNKSAIKQILQSTWQFKKQNSEKWHPAEVPGTVHTDLYNNELIPDPFYGENEQELQWIEKENWEYKTVFDLSDSIFNKNNIQLCFKGLDTYADVYLNDSLILKSDNMFREWTIDCKPLLKKTNNKMHIIFRSPFLENEAKFDKLTYELPAGNDRGHKRISVFTRKAPYHFGWDWGPRFVTSGIWRPIEITAWDETLIKDFQIYQLSLTDNLAKLKTEIEIQSETDTKVLLKLLNDKNILITKEIELHKGVNNIQETFNIRQPKLWWSNGLGDAHLYHFHIEIAKNGRICDYQNRNFGLRTIEVVQQNDSIGKSFYFKLNGIPVFMKGANYIPQDAFLPRVNKEDYKELISAAKSTHMNMLRVWGGGVYEQDVFYDLCDENGILVWQDFMFACSMYPGDSAFLSSVEQEAIENVKRLRNHPSIALWCGNNEMQVAWERWGYQKQYAYSKADSTSIYQDYDRLFHQILPQIIETYDAGRFYWPSSPNSAPSGWEEEAQSGDFHYWGVWWGKKPFSAYKNNIGRFMSEYGFQSLPSYSCVESFAPDSSQYLVSPILKAHNKHPIGFETIAEYMKRDVKIPKNFKDYIISSQLLQAEGMKTAIEAHRRAMPYCMGSLYWQLNDCWPVASWSSIDYTGHWKAFHYRLKKLFAPLLISPTYHDRRLDIFVVSDELKNQKSKMNISLQDFYGHILWHTEKEIEIAANKSSNVLSIEFDSIINDFNNKNIFLHCELIKNDKVLANNILFFTKTKNLLLPKAQLHIKEIQEGELFGIEISSPVFVKDVYLSYAKDNGIFSDNYFNILPNKPKTIWIDTENASSEFQNSMHIKSALVK